MPPLWLPKASAKPSYVTRPSSMVSPAAINDPMVAPTSSLKYSPVHWSGDSTTPSNDTIRPATISRMTPPLELPAVADWTCGRRETHRGRLDVESFSPAPTYGLSTLRRQGRHNAEAARPQPLHVTRLVRGGTHNVFGPIRGPWDDEWTGWWGDNPPYHYPVFALIKLFDSELVIRVTGAQDLLVELADAGLRDLVDERPPLGQLPLGHLVGEERLEVGGGDSRALRAHDTRQRSLVPSRIGDADHRRLDNLGMRHELVLELDRRDPLAARLDDVLGAVGDLDEAVLVDAADVAGAQPTVVELVGRGIEVVAAGDPRPPHFDLADSLAVPRQRRAGVVDDAQLDAADHATGLRAPVHLIARSGLDAAG